MNTEVKMKNSEKDELIAALSVHDVFNGVMDYAGKTGTLNLYISGSEKWNFPTEENNYQSDDKPKENGQYDVEGHKYADVYGFFKPALYSKIKSFFSYILDIIQFTKILPYKNRYTKKIIYKPYIPFRYIKEAFPFTSTWSNWVWTVESLSILKDDIAEEKLIESSNKKWYLDKDLYKKTVDGITNEEIERKLNEHYILLNTGVYAAKRDPTVILLDDRFYRYDLKDGYSDKYIAQTVFEVSNMYRGLLRKHLLKGWAFNGVSFNLTRKRICQGLADCDLGNLTEWKPKE